MPTLSNPKWEICALARAGGNTVLESYRAGGYVSSDVSTAAKLFKKPAVAARVLEIQNERIATERTVAAKAAEEAGVDRAWVIRHLKHNALAAMRGSPMYNNKGVPLKDEHGNPRFGKPDHAAAAKSLELIGRDQGMFINRHEVGGPGEFERMSDKELNKELIEQAMKVGLTQEAIKLLTYQPEAEEE